MRSVGILIRLLIAVAIVFFYSTFAYNYIMGMEAHYLIKMGFGIVAAGALSFFFSCIKLVVNPEDE